MEMDSKRTYDAILAQAHMDNVFGNYIDRVKILLRDNPSFSVRWVYRSANSVTHAFARAFRVFKSPHYWVEPPNFVDGLLNFCTSCA
ncbi:hypothetical protein ACS0TY_027890 [Phlomoides rotata]